MPQIFVLKGGINGKLIDSRALDLQENVCQWMTYSIKLEQTRDGKWEEDRELLIPSPKLSTVKNELR
jgi:hypothetical protein